MDFSFKKMYAHGNCLNIDFPNPTPIQVWGTILTDNAMVYKNHYTQYGVPYWYGYTCTPILILRIWILKSIKYTPI